MYGLAASDQANLQTLGKGKQKKCARGIFDSKKRHPHSLSCWELDFRGTDYVVVRGAKDKSGMIGKRRSDIKKNQERNSGTQV